MKLESAGVISYGQLVSKDGQALVEAELHPLLFERSFHDGDTYTLALLASGAVGASGTEILATIQNTSTTQLLCIESVIVCGDDAQGFAQVWTGNTSGGDGTAFTPLNHNRSSGRTAEATVYVSDASLTSTGGTQVCQKGLSPELSTAEMHFQGSLILGLNDTCDVRFLEQDAATPNVGVCVTGFYIDPPA